MKCDERIMRLYLVTDSAWIGIKTLPEQVEEALKGGVTCVQLREKELDDEEMLKEAIEIKALCRKYGVPFIVNDNVEVALACDADGVHIGQQDMEAGEVRQKIGKDKIMGVSAQTVEQAIRAEWNGADYLGVGAVFATSTKMDADTVSYETLKDICASVNIPVVAIGGINADNILKLYGAGAEGIAVVSAVFASNDIEIAASVLLAKSEIMTCT